MSLLISCNSRFFFLGFFYCTSLDLLFVVLCPFLPRSQAFPVGCEPNPPLLIAFRLLVDHFDIVAIGGGPAVAAIIVTFSDLKRRLRGVYTRFSEIGQNFVDCITRSDRNRPSPTPPPRLRWSSLHSELGRSLLHRWAFRGQS